MGWMDDVRSAVRSLTRRPAFTLFAVGTLALGIGATTAIYGTLEAVILDPVPFEGGDRMVGLYRRIGGGDAFVTADAELVDRIAVHDDLLERVERWAMEAMTLSGRGDATELMVARVRPSIHDFLGRPPWLGRPFDQAELVGEGDRVVLIGHALWKDAFGGSADALGQTLTLDGAPWTVIGVMPPNTPIPNFGLQRVDVWTPLGTGHDPDDVMGLGLLREGVDIAALEERLSATTEEGASWSATAVLIGEQVARPVREPMQLLMAAVVLLLLISCVNVANLLLFRADGRRRETAVRVALGSGRGRLVRQHLVESLLLAALGGAVGIGLAFVGQSWILELRPSQLDVLDQARLDGPALRFALAVTLVTGVLFGAAPALHAARPGTLETLRHGVRTAGDVAGRRLRWLFVAGEVALSFALLLGSLGVLDTLLDKQRADLGFDAGRVVTVSVALPSWRYEEEALRASVLEEMLGRLATLPSVDRVAQASGLPPRAGVWFGEPEVEGGVPSEETEVMFGPSADTAYLAALGQPLLSGRWFDADDMSGDQDVVVVSASTATRLFGDDDPIGKRFRLGSGADWMTVIGVTTDVPMTGLSGQMPELQAYHPLRTSWRTMTFALRATDRDAVDAVTALVPSVIREVEPDARISRLARAEALMLDTLERERFTTTIMATFAVLALFLAAIGLYGIVSQVVGQRTREIGIRVALGASRGRVASMVLRRAGGATLAGTILGAILAVAGSRVLDSAVVGVQDTGVTTYLLAAAGLTLTSFVAAYAPARRAAAVDPVDAIRVE